MAVKNSYFAKQKYWKNIVKQLENKSNYKRPKSHTKAAVRMRKIRVI